MAHLMGFDLMPRIRQWQDLIFWRPSPTVRYEHIDAPFGTPGRNVIDWDLIETHFKDLMQIAISIREGTISSAVLLRRLRSGSRRNATYVAFREVGQVIRTVQLLRFLSDGSLRRRGTAATNKVEAFNNFCQWPFFGKHGVIAGNDPDEQEKTMKFNALLSNCVIFHTTLELMEVIRQLQAEGWSIDPADLAEISPYITEPIRRFGEYSTDELDLRPDAFDPNLDVDFDTLTDPAPEAA
jgi:TnpA family transposase